MVPSNGMSNDEMKDRATMAWAGLDVSKKYFDAALLPPGTDAATVEVMSLAVERFDRTVEGASKCVAWLREQLAGYAGAWRLGVIMESSGVYSAPLAGWLRSAVPDARVAIENPHRTHGFIQSLGLRNKTDRLEARALALYGAQRKVWEYIPLTGARLELRELSRYRDSLVSQQTAMKNREEGVLDATSFAAKSHARLLKAITREIKAVDEQIRRVAATDAQLSQDVALLTRVSGVGPVVATTVLAELGDLRRFTDRHAAAAFAGLNPHVHESGDSVRRKPRQDKRGSVRARQVLYMSAMAVIHAKRDTALKRWYLRLLARGKPKMVAVAALMRKILLVMRAVLIDGHVDANVSKYGGKRSTSLGTSKG